jgi:hypothetical protein
MANEQRLARKDLEEVRDRLRQGPSDDAINPPLVPPFKTGEAGECRVLREAIKELAEEVSGLRAAVQGQASDLTKRSGAVLSDKAPGHSAPSDAGPRKRSLPLQSQDLAPCVLIDRPLGSSLRGQAAVQLVAPPTLQLEQAFPPPSVEATVAARAQVAAAFLSQRRSAPETPRVLPVRFQESRLLQQTADRSSRSSNPAADCAVAIAFEQGGVLGGGGRDSANALGSSSSHTQAGGDSKFDSAGGTLASSNHLDGHGEVGCDEALGPSSGTWAGSDPWRSGSEVVRVLRADSEPRDGHGDDDSGALGPSRRARAGSEPWVRPGQKTMEGEGGGRSLSARGQQRSSWRWRSRGEDPTSIAYASQGSARFFHAPPPPRGTWAIAHGTDAKTDLPPLAMRFAAAEGSSAGGRQHGQKGWVAALAAAMDVDEATDPEAGEH